MQIGEAFVAVRPDTSKFGAETSREVESSMRQTGQRASLSLGQALAGGAAAAGFSKLIGSASALEQAIGGTTAVFGESSSAIDAWAENSADAVGLSEASYRSLASFAGNQLKGLGFSTDEAAEKTNQLIVMGADLAATFGGTTEEAVQALSATFRGEYDPVERYVAGLRASTVAAKAVEMGLADSGGAISNYARGQATLALLTEGSADAQGQFAREADTAAGAQQRAAAAAENSSAAIGENFLPVYNQAIGVVTALAQAFGALPGPIQTGAVALAGYISLRAPISAAFGTMAGSIDKLKTGLVAVKGAFLGAEVASTSATASMAASLGPWAALAAVVVAIHTGLIDLTAAMGETELDTANVDEMTAKMTELGSASEGLLAHLEDTSEFDPSFFDALGTNAEDTAVALLATGDEWDTFVERVTGNLPEGADVGAFTEGLELQRSRAQAAADAFEHQGDAASGAAGGMDENATAASANAEALDLLTESIDAYLDKIQGTEEANAAAAEAQQGLFEALVTNGATFDVNTQKGRDNIAAINDWVDAIGGQVTAAADFVAAGGNAEVGQRRANKAVSDGVQDLRDLRDANIITQGQFEKYATQLNGLPRDITTEVGERGAAETGRRADDVREKIGRIPRIWNATINANNAAALREIAEAEAAARRWAAASYTAHLNIVANAPTGARLPGLQESAGGITESFSGGGGGAAESFGGGRAAPAIHVHVAGNVIGDVDRFADEIAFRAAEKIARTGAF